MVELAKVVSCVKHGASKDQAYFITDTSGSFATQEIQGELPLKVGEIVEEGASGNFVSSGRELGAAQLIEMAAQACSLLVKKNTYSTGNADVDRITLGMKEKLEKIAALIVRKTLLSAPTIVRFHNDADGSGGAYALYLSIRKFASEHSLRTNTIWLMQRGVSYSEQDAQSDILITNNYSCIEKPLLVIIDFGTNTESNAGIDKVADRFDIAWLDHHPIVPEFKGLTLPNYINTWQFNGDSNYTAGLLTSVMCKSFSEIDTSEMEGASLIGDYSDYATQKGAELSALLDFITSDLQAIYGPGKMNVTAQEIDAIVTNKDRSRELLEYANMRMEEAIDNGLKSIKKYSLRNANLAVLDFEDIRSEDSKYPLPGRYASKLLDKLDERGMKRTILVVSVGSYLLMRIDKELCADFDLTKAMEEMRNRYPDEIAGGGGHRCAGSIKLKFKELGRQMTASLVGIIRTEIGYDST